MRTFTLFLLLLLGTVSCNNKSRFGTVIPPDKFRDILIDIQLVDASYMLNYYKYSFHNDTLNFYTDLLSRYGYTRANFDSTMRYYSQEEKEFDDIYEEVITGLNKLQHEVYMLQRFETDSSQNLYKKKRKWQLPKDGDREKIPFDIVLKKNDTVQHSIFVQLHLLDDDGARNPHLTAYYWYDDGTRKGHREYFPEVPYEKSSKVRTYSTSMHPKSKRVTNIRGYILDSDWKPFGNKRHVEVKDIVVSKY
jgi:hypothetical protein